MVSCGLIIYCNIASLIVLLHLGPPDFLSLLLNNATVVEGESVSFVCEVTNDPDAIEDVTIRWFSDIDLILIDDDDRITISNTTETHPSRTVMSTLTIDPVIHQDAGQYRCVALNHPELMVSDTTQLTVECKLTSSLSEHTSVVMM